MKTGDMVKLVSLRHGDTANNPVWGGKFGRVMGTIQHIRGRAGLPVEVGWDNEETNDYTRRDLEVIGRGRRKVKTKTKKKKAPKKRKKIITPTIKIAVSVYNALCRALKNFKKRPKKLSSDSYPYCYLLGKNKGGIFTEMVRLKRAGYNEGVGDNCYRMINISPSVIALASVEIYKEQAIPCGIARVGEFRLDQSFGDRGGSLNEVGKMGGFILSMVKDGIKIEQYIKGIVKTLEYAIVKNEKQIRKK